MTIPDADILACYRRVFEDSEPADEMRDTAIVDEMRQVIDAPNVAVAVLKCCDWWGVWRPEQRAVIRQRIHRIRRWAKRRITT